MQSWMIGVVAGVLPVGLLAQLPSQSTLALTGLAAIGMLLVPRWYGRLGSGVLVGVCLACTGGHSVLEHRLRGDCVGVDLVLTGTVSSLPRISRLNEDTERQRFEFSVESILPANCSGPRKVLLSFYGPGKLQPGQELRLRARLNKPWGLANPGSFNMQAWFASSGIDGVGSVRGSRLVSVREGGNAAGLHQRLRLKVRERIARLDITPQARAALAAVTVADKSGIDGSMWSLLQTFGINHLLVVSGLHVGLVAGVGYLLGCLISRPLLLAGWNLQALSPVLGYGSALAYAALAGFSLPTQRAVVMLGCFCLAPLLGRVNSPGNSFLVAALLVLLLNPLAPLQSGFWLSFGAVAALLWRGRWQSGRGFYARLLGTHLYMSLAMVPLGGWWFGGASLVAAPANFLLIPLVGMFVVPVALGATALHLLGVQQDEYLWRLAAAPLDYLVPVAEQLVQVAGHGLYRPLAFDTGALLSGLAALVLMSMPPATLRLVSSLVLFIPLLLLPDPQRGGVGTRVTFLDVGQGTAVVVQSGSRALLYDTGGGDPAGSNMAASVVLPYLRHRGISRLDSLVISHPDLDHSAGVTTLLGALPVARYRRGGYWPAGTPGRACRVGESWRWPGGESFQFLGPAPGKLAASNNASCVLLIDIGGRRVLLPGDIEEVQERELVRYWRSELNSDFLMAAHHGSRTSSGRAWLKFTDASSVIVSSGYANRFGHPHPAVLSRIEDSGARVSLTSSQGAIELLFAGEGNVREASHRQHHRYFWM